MFYHNAIYHFLLASITLSFDLLLSSCVAIPELYTPFVPGGAHSHMLLPLCLV